MKKFIDIEIMYEDDENFDTMLDEAVAKIKEGGVGGFINDGDKTNSCRFGVVRFYVQSCQTEKMSI
jgi:hypothetical protein